MDCEVIVTCISLEGDAAAVTVCVLHWVTFDPVLPSHGGEYTRGGWTRLRGYIIIT